jgi:hypothetical protein
LFQTLRHWRQTWSDPQYRARDAQPRADFERFCRQDGGLGLRADVFPPGGPTKTVLIVSQSYLPFAKMEAWMMKAFQMAGFRTVVLGYRRYEFMRYGWLAGNRRVLEATDFAPEGDPAWVDAQVSRLRTLDEWLKLEYEGVHVGRFTVASALRRLKVGQLDFHDPATRDTLKGILSYSVYLTRGSIGALDAVKPDCILVMDRGYSGHGEIFDLALNRGIDTVVWTTGYRSNRLLVKRYHSGNERMHPLCPSPETWRAMGALPWKAEYGQAVRDELLDCYQSQDWFSVGGTQFDKQILSAEATRAKLGLAPDRKVAVIFPHILWDGSFFWGEDLFEHYTQWLIETIRAAAANPRLQWVVKLHPAHLVKAKQANDPRRPAELDVLEQSVGPLPPHVQLVHPDTDLSTYSLFQIADYAVTVRGTVGIEAAVFGIPVVTAGTGRYDRRGFTVDSSSRAEYLRTLATLDTVPRLSPEQVRLAERFAYEVLFCRPLRLTSASLEFARDGKATPRFTVHCRRRDEWLQAADMRQLSAWLADGKAEDMVQLPPG